MSPRFLNLGDFLAQVADEDAPTARRTHKLSKEAQIANLEAVWHAYSTPHCFVPGDLVQEKDGLGYFRVRGIALLYVRALDLTTWYDQQLVLWRGEQVQQLNLDCLVVMVDDEGTILPSPHDSRVLEPLR